MKRLILAISLLSIMLAPGYVSATDPVGDPTIIGLWRLYNPITYDHFYTTSSSEKTDAETRSGYRQEGGVAGYIHANPTNNTTPLYRLYNPSSRQHFYTIDLGEKNAVTTKYGYIDEGITGYVETQGKPNTLALRRLYNSTTRDHFYVMAGSFGGDDEVRAAIQNHGYADEGISGYIHFNNQFDVN